MQQSYKPNKTSESTEQPQNRNASVIGYSTFIATVKLVKCDEHNCTVIQALVELIRRPRELLLSRWNWKAALFSALWRGGIFFGANFTAGVHAAAGAMLADATYRVATVGFYAAITQQISRARPVWCASISALLILPVVAHTIEFLLHSVRGTPNLKRSILISLAFTAVATLFNVHAMSQGAFTVGPGSHSIAADFRALPRTILSFVVALPLAVVRRARRGQ